MPPMPNADEERASVRCQECRRAMPVEAKDCPVCGWTQGSDLSVKARAKRDIDLIFSIGCLGLIIISVGSAFGPGGCSISGSDYSEPSRR